MELDPYKATERMVRVRSSFKILRVVIRDQDTGEIYWDSQHHAIGGDHIESSMLMEAHLPARMLQSKAVTRQVTFYSGEKLQKLNLRQKAFLGNLLMESFHFNFGFVIPGSTNNWDQTTISAEPDKMIPVNQLSGNLMIHITFYEGEEKIYEVKLKIFYD